MLSIFLQFILNIQKELFVVFISMLPVAELRAGIPLGFAYGFSPQKAFSLAVIGNAIPVFFILKYIGNVTEFLSKRSKFFRSFFDWLFKRTNLKISGKYQKYGLLALMIFVAVPLPVTGAWTGTLGAWLLGINTRKAIPFIFLGILIAGIIVTLLSMGVFSFF